MPKQASTSLLWKSMLAFVLIGMTLSTYLIYLHYKVHTDIDYKSICGINAKINCESVARSDYAVAFGAPVAAWGTLGYGLLFLLLVFGLRSTKRSKELLGCLGFLFGFGFLSSGYYAWISHSKIQAYCTHCMGMYGINILLLPILFFFCLRSERVTFTASLKAFFIWLKSNSSSVVIMIFFAVSLGCLYPPYWKESGVFKTKTLPHGATQNHHWIGALHPIVTVLEFADYQCGYCKIFHKKLRDIVQRNANTLRIVHRHFPLDHHCNPEIKQPFHEHACLLAKAAHCAGKQDKFWNMNDLLFEKNKAIQNEQQLINEAKALNLDLAHFSDCLSSKKTTQAILSDIQAGKKKKIRGTPAFFIDDKAYVASLKEFEKGIVQAIQSKQHKNKIPNQVEK